MAQKLSIDIVSDPVCPWCYVGKRRLERALLARPELDVTVRWQPFQLNPDMPREGRNRREYYHQKFGPELAEKILGGLGDTGAEEGIAFGTDPEAMAPNTLSAHVLLYWAVNDDRIDASALAEQLFHAHHVACENIGDHEVLARIAAEAGMDAADVRRRLAGREDEEAVNELIAQSVSRGVTGVPFFIVNGKYGISGAQPPEVLLDAFDQISRQEPGSG